MSAPAAHPGGGFAFLGLELMQTGMLLFLDGQEREGRAIEAPATARMGVSWIQAECGARIPL